MQTPAKYLHIKGMPKVLPCEYFTWELNQALMAKNDMELLAAGMCVAGEQADSGRGSPDLRGFQWVEGVVHEYNNGKTSQQRSHELYVTMVEAMIMDEVKFQIWQPKAMNGEDDDDESCNEGKAKKPRLADGEDK